MRTYIKKKWQAFCTWIDQLMWKREFRKVMTQIIENTENCADLLQPSDSLDILTEQGFNRFYGNASPEDAAYYVQGVW